MNVFSILQYVQIEDKLWNNISQFPSISTFLFSGEWISTLPSLFVITGLVYRLFKT